jgi:hypothetical protein
MKKSNITSLILSLLVTTSLIGASVKTTTADINANSLEISKNESKSLLSKEEELNLRKELSKDGISLDIQNKLIEKKKNGELWDCEIPEKFNSIPDDFFQSLAKTNQIKYIFDDGSYLLMRKGVEDVSTKSYYEQNLPRVTVEASYGGSRASIYANISYFYGVEGVINSVEPVGYIHVGNGSIVSDPQPYVAIRNGTNSNPAQAKYLPKISRPNVIGGSKTATLEYTMYVGGSKYWADLKQY